jgi:hypothetical protein
MPPRNRGARRIPKAPKSIRAEPGPVLPKPEWLVRRQCREQGLGVLGAGGHWLGGSPFCIEIRGGGVVVQWDSAGGEFIGWRDGPRRCKFFTRSSVSTNRWVSPEEIGSLKTFFELSPSEGPPPPEYAESVHASLHEMASTLWYMGRGRPRGPEWDRIDSLRMDIGWSLSAFPAPADRLEYARGALRASVSSIRGSSRWSSPEEATAAKNLSLVFTEFINLPV